MKDSLRSLFTTLRRTFPVVYDVYRRVRHADDVSAVKEFMAEQGGMSLEQKKEFVRKIKIADNQIDCAHTQAEMLHVARHIIRMRDSGGVIVEAGSFKGGSAAKISVIAKMMNKDLVVFDSFEGIPENDENHTVNIFGGSAGFARGDYAGSLDEVKRAIMAHGILQQCQFHKGFFDKTLPDFSTPICVAFIDVDLVSSTQDCLKYLYPLLVPGGVIISQDGHLPLVLEALQDEGFWRDNLGIDIPRMDGLGTSKLVTIWKD